MGTLQKVLLLSNLSFLEVTNHALIILASLAPRAALGPGLTL